MSNQRTKRGKQITSVIGLAVFNIEKYIKSLSDDERSSLVADIEAMNESNCAYWEFRSKKGIAQIVNSALSDIENDRRSARIGMGLLEDIK